MSPGENEGMKFTALTVAVALALCSPSIASADAPGLAPLASLAAAQSITVTCSVPADAPEAGYTVVGGSRIWLTSQDCSTLSRLVRGDSRWLAGATDSVDNVYLAGQAIQVLTHEATHLRLESGDEALVECTASRNYWPVIRSLHLPSRLAGRILAAATRTHRNLANALYKSDC